MNPIALNENLKRVKTLEDLLNQQPFIKNYNLINCSFFLKTLSALNPAHNPQSQALFIDILKHIQKFKIVRP